MNMLDP